MDNTELQSCALECLHLSLCHTLVNCGQGCPCAAPGGAALVLPGTREAGRLCAVDPVLPGLALHLCSQTPLTQSKFISEQQKCSSAGGACAHGSTALPVGMHAHTFKYLLARSASHPLQDLDSCLCTGFFLMTRQQMHDGVRARRCLLVLSSWEQRQATSLSTEQQITGIEKALSLPDFSFLCLF